jgi:PAS domain S-box-containing protein
VNVGAAGAIAFRMPNEATPISEALLPLLEAVNEGALILTPQGIVQYCNASFATMTGGGPSKIAGRRLQDLVASTSQGQVLALLARGVERPCRDKIALLSADGRTIPVGIAVQPFRDGTAVSVCAVVTDLSGMDTASEARLSLAAIVEASMDAILSESPDGTVLSWNRGAETLYGYTAEEMVGSSIRKIVPAEKQDELSLLLNRILRGEATEDFETVRQCHDGRRVDISLSISPLRDSLGRITGACTIARDITASKGARKRVQCVLESAPDAIVVFNESGEIVFVNSATEKAFLFSRHELIGRPVDVLMPERTRLRRLSLFRQPSRSLHDQSLRGKRRLTLHRADGTEFPAEVSFGRVEEDQTRLVCGLIRDITERLTLEEMLREKNLQLEEALQAKDRFLAAMSHELRTPLNGIIGVTGLLLMKLSGTLTADQERQLEIIRISAKHLLSIINDLLDLAKLTSGKNDVHLEPVRCEEVMEEVASALQPLAAEKNLELSFVHPGADVVLQTNRRFLRQILFNLASNAVKYTENGSVSMSVECASDAGKPVIRFVVADTGIGIVPEDQSKLFSEFARLHEDRGTPKDSTGLGLHLSQKMAALLGGEITMESEPGKGSAFTLTLNATPAASSSLVRRQF